MTPRILFASVGVVLSLVGGAVAFQPERIFTDNYSFFQYMLDVFAIPLIIIGIAMLVVFLVVSIAGGHEAVKTIMAWRDKPLRVTVRAVRTGSVLTMVLLALSGSWTCYESYKLARNSFSYARDRLFPQYRLELLSRYAIDVSQGNLRAAKSGYQAYADRFKGLDSAAEAEKSGARIDRMLAVKQSIVDRAHAYDRMYGVSLAGVHFKAEALAIHPWDSTLREEIAADIHHAFLDYMPALLSDLSRCTAPNSIPSERLRISRDLMLLGFERAADANIKDADLASWKARLCTLSGGLSADEIAGLIDGIWQRKKIEALLDDSAPEHLEIARNKAIAELRQAQSKWLAGPGSHEPAATEVDDSMLDMPPPFDLPNPPPMLADEPDPHPAKPPLPSASMPPLPPLRR